MTAPGVLPSYESLESSLKSMRDHMVANNVKQVAMPQIGMYLIKCSDSKDDHKGSFGGQMYY